MQAPSFQNYVDGNARITDIQVVEEKRL